MSSELSTIKSDISKLDNVNTEQNTAISRLQYKQNGLEEKLSSNAEQLTSLQRQLNILQEQLNDTKVKVIEVQTNVTKLEDRLRVIEKYREDQDFFNRNIDDKETETNLIEIDEYVMNITEESTDVNDYANLVSDIIENSKSNYEKARAIFIWIANNISYDVTYSIYDADKTFKNRKGVCSGYSALYEKFCKLSGLEVKTITGIAKTITYKVGDGLDDKSDGHAWNAVKDDDGRWFLVDATWGAGYVNGNVFTREIKSYWFDPDPSIFALSHLPQDSEWQLIEQPVSRSEFESFPPIYPNLGLMGLNGENLLKRLRAEDMPSFPYVYSFDAMLKINDMPLTKNLSSKQKYKFSFTTLKENKIAIIQNGKFTYFEGTGEGKTLEYQPQRGDLQISINTPNDVYYHTMFLYSVE